MQWHLGSGELMPRFIALLLVLIALMDVAYVADFLIGSPSDTLTTFVNLDQDQNLSTWFSSALWLGAAVLTWVFATHTVSMNDRGSWTLLLLPLLFVAFSIDEVSRLHEAIGVKLDKLLLGVDRVDTILPATGVWIVVIGVPIVIALVLITLAVRPQLSGHRAAFTKIVVGLITVFTGALGIEALSNIVSIGTFAGIVQVLVEETVEMVGATIVLWGSYELQLTTAKPLEMEAQVEKSTDS